MKCTVEKIEFWSGQIRDEIGGLAKSLQPVVDAGVNFSFVIARRQPDHPGEGHVFFGGIHGPKEAKIAEQCGFIQADSATYRWGLLEGRHQAPPTIHHETRPRELV